MIFTDIRPAIWAPRAQAVLRIVTAYLFLFHGAAKLLHVPQYSPLR